MKDKTDSQSKVQSLLRVGANKDQFGEHRWLGVSEITFKVTPKDSNDIFIIENTFHEKGGPAKHLQPGDSVLAPRKIPHVWAYSGNQRGRILIAFMPAGKMESFFREVTKANAMPPQDPELWHSHGMELLGPPLKV